jgi:hypothetical protein
MSTEENTTGASEDMKRKFKEALDKKNATQNPGEGHQDANSSVHHAQGPAGHKREFRRKSG